MVSKEVRLTTLHKIKLKEEIPVIEICEPDPETFMPPKHVIPLVVFVSVEKLQLDLNQYQSQSQIQMIHDTIFKNTD